MQPRDVWSTRLEFLHHNFVQGPDFLGGRYKRDFLVLLIELEHTGILKVI